MEWYFLLFQEVYHTRSSFVFHQFEPGMEVTNFLLTRNGMRCRIPLASTHCTRREYTAEPILTEPHSQRRH
jgi:hypothetical protein